VVDVLQGLRVDVDVHHGDEVVDCGLHQALEDGCHQIFGVVDVLGFHQGEGVVAEFGLHHLCLLSGLLKSSLILFSPFSSGNTILSPLPVSVKVVASLFRVVASLFSVVASLFSKVALEVIFS